MSHRLRINVSWCYSLDRRIKNDRVNYVTKQARQVWGCDPPGVTQQRMLLKELLLESTDCCFLLLKQF